MIDGDDRHASVPFMLFVIDFLNAAHIYVLFFYTWDLDIRTTPAGSPSPCHFQMVSLT